MRVRKRPVEVDAIQLTPELTPADLHAFLGGFEVLDATMAGERRCLHIKTLEGTMRADEGDWIIKGVNGEFYPCKDEIFQKTYDIVGGGA